MRLLRFTASVLLGLVALASLVLTYLSYDRLYGLDYQTRNNETVELQVAEGGIYVIRGQLRADPRYPGGRWFAYRILAGAWEEDYGIEPRRWQGIRVFSVQRRFDARPASVVVISTWLIPVACATCLALIIWRYKAAGRKEPVSKRGFEPTTGDNNGG